ncbi:MAG: PDZ domain-containing protein [bacterium]|nr:PDZ domain-containing protein [bacterium]
MKNILKIGLIALMVMALGAGFALAKNKHDRGWLGVYTQTVDEDLAKAFDLPIDRGAIVNSVVEDSPAEESGIEEDDIIVAIGGSKVFDQTDLIDMIGDIDPGDEVNLTVWRDGKELELTALIDNWREDDHRFYIKDAPHSRGFNFLFSDKDRPYIGVTLIEVSRELAVNMGAESYGVLINEVEEDSPAEEAGLKPGDLVVAVDDEKVRDAGDVQELIRDHEVEEIARLDIIRDKKPQTVEVTVNERDDGYYSGGSHILNLTDLPHFDFHAPKMRGLHRSLDFDFGGFDSEEFQEEMEDLKEELSEMQRELKELRRQLQ